MVQLVDWDLAAATAATLGKSGPKVDYSEAAAVVAQLRELTDLADGHVRSFTGLRSRVSHPPVRVVDRPDWAAANLAGLNTMFTPLLDEMTQGREPGALAQAVGPRIAGVQAGTVLAYLSGKVLGQYEVFANDPGQLLLVAPNIVEVERKLDAVPRDFRLWVCLHEVTHRAQFTAVPWMREFFLSEVTAFVHATQLETGQLLDRLRRAIEAIARSIRSPQESFNVLDLVQTPAQREVLDRLTAMMTLLEGHAEYVMDGVGPDVVPSVDEIRAKFNQRREVASPAERVVRKLLGIDVKLRQYAEGRRFVHAVVDRVGMDGFNQVWTSAETLPRSSEFGDPDAWVARVLGHSSPGGGTPSSGPDGRGGPSGAVPSNADSGPEPSDGDSPGDPSARQAAVSRATDRKPTAKSTATADTSTTAAKRATKETAAKKTAASKAADKKTAASKAAAKKGAAKKAAAKKTPAKKATVKKTAAKQASPPNPARKATAKKTPAKKATGRKSTGEPAAEAADRPRTGEASDTPGTHEG